MAIELDRFCINRKVAPGLTLPAFFRLAKRLGINKVELRNDMYSGNVTDNLSHARVSTLAEQHQLEIVSINALYPFNQLTPQLLERAEVLLQEANDLNAKAIILCPLNDGTPVSVQETKQAFTLLSAMFIEAGVEALVEPLGFPVSSLRSAHQTQQLIRETNVPFRIVLDTFHHHLYEQAENEFALGIDVENIGLVHLSGVEDKRPAFELTDEQRVMLSKEDVLNNVSQVKRLEKMGYRGNYSFEPFSSSLADWDESQIEKSVRESIALLQV
mgnify:CR=1 FL=1